MIVYDYYDRVTCRDTYTHVANIISSRVLCCEDGRLFLVRCVKLSPRSRLRLLERCLLRSGVIMIIQGC